MKKSGFTILEILVVLAVLVILIGIAVPRIKGMQDQGKIAKVKSELKTIQTALETYRINKKPLAYPATTSRITEDVLVIAVPQVVPNIMYDPFGATTTTEYVYVLSANGEYYVIASNGPDALVLNKDIFGGVTEAFAKGHDDGGGPGGDEGLPPDELEETTIDNDGVVTKASENVICVTNGSGC